MSFVGLQGRLEKEHCLYIHHAFGYFDLVCTNTMQVYAKKHSTGASLIHRLMQIAYQDPSNPSS